MISTALCVGYTQTLLNCATRAHSAVQNEAADLQRHQRRWSCILSQSVHPVLEALSCISHRSTLCARDNVDLMKPQSPK